MSQLELSTLANPRRDRAYQVELSSAASLPCKVEGGEDGTQASFFLRYTPGQHCIEARSFGRFLDSWVHENEISPHTLESLLSLITQSSSPLKAELEVAVTASAGSRFSFVSSYPSSSIP